MKRLSVILPLLALLATGCGSVTYLPYQGAQQDWPTADHAFAKTVNGITIYRGLPPKPYIVLGLMTFFGDSDYVEGQLVWMAKQQGADAIIIDIRSEGPGGDGGTIGGAYGGPTRGGFVAGGNSYSWDSPATSLEGRLIRFKDSPPKPTPDTSANHWQYNGHVH